MDALWFCQMLGHWSPVFSRSYYFEGWSKAIFILRYEAQRLLWFSSGVELNIIFSHGIAGKSSRERVQIGNLKGNSQISWMRCGLVVWANVMSLIACLFSWCSHFDLRNEPISTTTSPLLFMKALLEDIKQELQLNQAKRI